MFSRRQLVAGSAITAASSFLSKSQTILPILDVASAGSFRMAVEGPLRDAARKSLGLELRSHAMGADAVAKAIVDGSLQADVFVPITVGPMRTVFAGGKADMAVPIARTEMVIVYSPRSPLAARFTAAAGGNELWWQVMEAPGLKIARSDPGSDPGGRNMIFVMMLAAKKYGESDLVGKVLGQVMNPAQVGLSNAQALLKGGEIDAMGSYKTGPLESGLPFLSLPSDINLSEDDVAAKHPEVKLDVGGKLYAPETTVFYAATLKNAKNPAGATAFVDWLQQTEAQELLRHYGFDAVGRAKPIRA
jgi:molybdate/tungstate transport system substrate-binding protein